MLWRPVRSSGWRGAWFRARTHSWDWLSLDEEDLHPEGLVVSIGAWSPLASALFEVATSSTRLRWRPLVAVSLGRFVHRRPIVVPAGADGLDRAWRLVDELAGDQLVARPVGFRALDLALRVPPIATTRELALIAIAAGAEGDWPTAERALGHLRYVAERGSVERRFGEMGSRGLVEHLLASDEVAQRASAIVAELEPIGHTFVHDVTEPKRR